MTSKLSLELLQLTQALLQEPSVTPEVCHCFDHVVNTLSSHKQLSFRRMDHQGVANLFISTRTAKSFPLLFSGHVDVVPPGIQAHWRHPPFQPTVENQCLYGRGAVDMKSSVSAFVTAVNTHLLRHQHDAMPIAIMLTSDEEGPARHGTQHMIETLRQEGLTFQNALVGEPTSVRHLGDTIKVGRRGSLTGKLMIQGTQMHVAYSHAHLNPLAAMSQFLSRAATWHWETHPAENFPSTQFTPTRIESSSGASNTTPEIAHCQFNFRYNPAVHANQLKHQVEQLLESIQLPFTLEWEHGASPFYKKPGPFVKKIQHLLQHTLDTSSQISTSGGTSDARFLAKHCTELVELGPLCGTAHQIDEHIPLTDLAKLHEIYGLILDSFVNHSPGLPQNS